MRISIPDVMISGDVLKCSPNPCLRGVCNASMPIARQCQCHDGFGGLDCGTSMSSLLNLVTKSPRKYFMIIEKGKFEVGIGNVSRVVRKRFFLHMQKKDADQLRGDLEADQRLCFRYIGRIIPLRLKSQVSSHLLWLYSPICVRPGRKTRRPVFSQRGLK